ncbi:DUF2510 domain-containing protein [Rhodococcoides fascians]|uniref:DUF2510 domain-containing protein n=1 Tax=Rhodococcoides fascians TaxID=1828 RepID=UPI003794F6F2
MDTPGSGPTDSSDNPAPGWYPDPHSPALRWWDGNNWSDTVVAIPQSQPPPPTDNSVPASSRQRQSSPAASTKPLRAAQLFRRHRKRLLIDTVLLLGASFLLFAAFWNLGKILGGSPETADYVRVAILPLAAGGAAFWLWRRSQFYVDRHPDGEAAGTRLRDVLMGVWFVGTVVLSVLLAVQAADREPSLSGTELQSMLRSNLGAAEGSPARTDTIACPMGRDFVDGDVARCTVETYGDTIEVLVVTVFWEGDDWRLGIDIG